MSSSTSRKAKNATQQTKAATQKYANATENKAKEVHDALATATAKGVDEAHIRASKATDTALARQKTIFDKLLQLIFEFVGALSGITAGFLNAARDLFCGTVNGAKTKVNGAKTKKLS